MSEGKYDLMSDLWAGVLVGAFGLILVAFVLVFTFKMGKVSERMEIINKVDTYGYYLVNDNMVFYYTDASKIKKGTVSK